MRNVQPVSISTGGFTLCKYSVAIILWTAVFMPGEVKIALVSISTLILLLSAVLGVESAPMVKLYDWTVGKFYPTQPVMLDRKGMRFAHGLGAGLNGLTLLLLLLVPVAGVVALVLTAMLKTVSAVGYCSGLKLYQCMGNDTCCRTTKAVVKGLKR